MYEVMERHRDQILDAIAKDETSQYRWLRMNRQNALDPEYQTKYRAYWAMNAAQLSQNFLSFYFQALKDAELKDTEMKDDVTLKDLCMQLWGASVRKNETRSLQFSFATKLRHMVNPILPIYDSRVARFYLFLPSYERPLEERIKKFVAFYEFLKREYARVIREGYLTNSIRSFRNRFDSTDVTDEKIIDWIIWTFVGLADKEEVILRGSVVYR